MSEADEGLSRAARCAANCAGSCTSSCRANNTGSPLQKVELSQPRVRRRNALPAELPSVAAAWESSGKRILSPLGEPSAKKKTKKNLGSFEEEDPGRRHTRAPH